MKLYLWECDRCGQQFEETGGGELPFPAPIDLCNACFRIIAYRLFKMLSDTERAELLETVQAERRCAAMGMLK